MTWFELKGDSRLGRCATENCGGQPVMRLEADGTGSNYCSGCHWKITQMTQRNELKDKIADAIGSSFQGRAGWNDVCAEAVLSAIEQKCFFCGGDGISGVLNICGDCYDEKIVTKAESSQIRLKSATARHRPSSRMREKNDMNRDELKQAIAIALRSTAENMPSTSTGGYFLRSHAFQAAEACLSAIEQSGCTICDGVSCNRPETVEQSVSPDKPALQTGSGREARWQPLDTAPLDGKTVDLWVRIKGTSAERRIPDCSWGWIRKWTGEEVQGWIGLGHMHEERIPLAWMFPPQAPSQIEEAQRADTDPST